jgi:hypothetical protein
MRKTLLPFAAATLTAACFVLPPSEALASPSFTFEATGANTLDIIDFTVVTYESNLTISPIGTAMRTGQTYTFPIVSGVVDAQTIDLEAISTGGMDISNGKEVVTLDSPIVDTTLGQPVMSFQVTVNGTLKGRYDMFDLKVPSYAKPQNLAAGESVKAANITVSLSPLGATTLNKALGTTFSNGLNVGTLKVKSVLNKKLPL